MNKHIYVGLLLAATLGFSSCDDEDTPIYPEENDKVVEVPQLPEFNTGIELFSVIKGQTKSQEISNGTGNYRVMVLDNSIAKASVEGNTITVEGIAQGWTEIVLSNSEGNYQNIKVETYLSDNIKASKETMDMALFMGKPSTDSFVMEEGNGFYEVTSSNEEVASAKVKSGNANEIEVTAKAEGEVEITVKDCHGLTTKVKVTVTNSDSPFSPQQLEEIKANSEIRYVSGTDNYMDFTSNKEYHNGQRKTYSLDFSTYYYAIGVNQRGRFSDICVVRFDNFEENVPLEIGKIDGGKLILRRNNTYKVNAEPCTFEIIKKEGGKVWAIFYNEKASGHMVFKE